MIEGQELFRWLDAARERMIGLQRLLTSIPALAPENRGEGEARKAAALEAWLQEAGLGPVQNFPSQDPRVPGGVRPNVMVHLEGQDSEKSLWIMSHLDVVPPGDPAQWESDPYEMVERNGRLYGRGTEDNQQGMVSSIFALLALKEAGIVPPRDVKLLFVADEEVGSTYGVQALLRDHGDLFRPEDLFLIPDGGRPDGSMIEVAEKSLLWLRFALQGRQVHASMPHLGQNAFLAGSDLVLRLGRGLPEAFPKQDPIFEPPYSTFSPTKKEANVPNVNTIPGLDVFYLDCRILPSQDMDEILAKIDEISRSVEKDYGVKVSREVLQRKSSVPTSADSPLVASLKKAVEKVYAVQADVMGIGGGTVGAFLRNAGYHTVIWSTLEETAHMPNEYCVIDNMINDAKVMLELMLEDS